MLLQPDKAQFIEAMRVEVASMFAEKIWRRVPEKEMLDHFHQLKREGQDARRPQIMMIWSFKRKRSPDGTITKHKARLCCHGGQQQWGVNYWDTYAPVVTWSSIRILMTLACLHQLHTKSVDFVQAYPQAKVKSTIYLRTPQGVELTQNNNQEQTTLKLEKNLYGLKDAGRTWYEHLTDGLHAMGFRSTESDPCILTQGTNIIILYVDDCIIMSRTKSEADRIYHELEQRGYKMTDEGSMEQYLGIQITKDSNNTFRLNQPYLIERILKSVPSMENAKPAKTPSTAGTILTKDEQGKETERDLVLSQRNRDA